MVQRSEARLDPRGEVSGAVVDVGRFGGRLVERSGGSHDLLVVLERPCHVDVSGDVGPTLIADPSIVGHVRQSEIRFVRCAAVSGRSVAGR